MKTQNYIKAFWGIIITLVLMSACKKYEEGPLISFIPKIDRITGSYELEEYYIIVDDIKYDLLEENNIQGIQIIYNKNGTGKETILREGGNIIREFEWQFDETKDFLHERTKINENEFTGWITNQKIMRLTRNELWISVLQSQQEEIVTKYLKR